LKNFRSEFLEQKQGKSCSPTTCWLQSSSCLFMETHKRPRLYCSNWQWRDISPSQLFMLLCLLSRFGIFEMLR